MAFVVQVIAHTPAPVFALLAYLLWQGIRSLRPRTQPVWVALLVPAAFMVSGLFLLLRRLDGPAAGAAWLCAALAALPLGSATGPRVLYVDRARARVTRAGSPVPLLRNLVVFGLQYGIAVGAALHPSLHTRWALAGAAVSGLSVGYFAGWGLALRRRYRDAPSVGPELRSGLAEGR